MGNFNTIITATAKEEILHGKFGSELINIVKNENPEWFDEEMEKKIRRNIKKAFDSESKVIDWVMEMGEPNHISKLEVLEFLKVRLNKCSTRQNIPGLLARRGLARVLCPHGNLARRNRFKDS